MKICIYTSSFYPIIGGIENFVYLLGKEFVKLGAKVTVLTDTKKKTKNNFPFTLIRTNSFLSKIKVFKENEIILCNNFSFKVIPAAILSKKKIFVVHHSAYHMNGCSFFSREFFISYIKTRLCFLFKNISVSKFVSNSIPVKNKIIPNVYNNNLIKRINKKKKKDFVFCGRLVSDKGTSILLKAFSKVVKKKKYSFLTIIGNGPEYKKLKKEALILNLNKNIHFTGNLSDKRKNLKLNEHYCMVVPSLWNEPFGSVALEGLATTNYVISSNKGGLPEAIENCGKLINPNEKKLSQAMLNYLKYKKFVNYKMLKNHIEKCENKLSKHQCNFIAKEYLSFFYETYFKQND
tara:strand:- start:2219 stop:3262 length:1044 start_codon:yes stop_codon:yes gene_type:complete